MEKCTEFPAGRRVLAATAAASVAQEAKLIAVLKSGATQEEKADACRELARVRHQASPSQPWPPCWAMRSSRTWPAMPWRRSPIRPWTTPSATPWASSRAGRLMGVIGSLGVRRDAKAVGAMAKLLADPEVAQAAARALGNIGTPEAAKALTAALADASAANQKAFCEGLFRMRRGCRPWPGPVHSHDALNAQGARLAVAGDLRPSPRAAASAAADPRRRPFAAPSSPAGRQASRLLLEAVRRHGLCADGRRRAGGHGTARPGGHRRACRRVAQAARRQASLADQHPGLPRRCVGRARPAGLGLEGSRRRPLGRDP